MTKISNVLPVKQEFSQKSKLQNNQISFGNLEDAYTQKQVNGTMNRIGKEGAAGALLGIIMSAISRKSFGQTVKNAIDFSLISIGAAELGIVMNKGYEKLNNFLDLKIKKAPKTEQNMAQELDLDLLK